MRISGDKSPQKPVRDTFCCGRTLLIVTEEISGPEPECADINTSGGGRSSPPHDLPSSSNPSPIPAPITVEERATQLQHTLSALNAEREALAGDLKSTRKDAQKADAALRAEIENLKRASEKQAAVEHRTRQKILALQEAVKQAVSATQETDELAQEVEENLPELQSQKDKKEKEYLDVKDMADKARQEKDKAERCRRKKADAMKNELSTLGNKLEKLNNRKDKLENEVISGLEEQLRKLELDVERTESGDYGYIVPSGDPEQDAYGDVQDATKGYSTPPAGQLGSAFSRRPGRHAVAGHAAPGPYHPRTSGSSHRPGPIQRPTPSTTTISTTSSTHSRLAANRSGFIGSIPFGPQHPRTQSQGTPDPRGRSVSSQIHNAASVAYAAPRPPVSASGPTNPASAPNTTTGSPSSTLSGRAAPFEPSTRAHGGAFGPGTKPGPGTVATPNSSASDLNPTSTPFEPKTILTNPNRHPPIAAQGGKRDRTADLGSSSSSPRAAVEESTD
jgi:hypothetical protein